MNVKRVQLLLDKLESLNNPEMEKHYNQSWTIHDEVEKGVACGTPACLMGHTIGLKYAKKFSDSHKIYIDEIKRNSNYYVEALEWLGLSYEQAEELFLPDPYGENHTTTIWEAICTLEHLLETGKVEWQ